MSGIKIPQEVLKLVFDEVFYQDSQMFPGGKGLAQNFFVRLSETPYHYSKQWNKQKHCFENPDIVDKLHFETYQGFGPVSLIYIHTKGKDPKKEGDKEVKENQTKQIWKIQPFKKKEPTQPDVIELSLIHI